MSDIVPFFSSHTTQNGQKVSGGLARQAKRQQEEIAIRTEHAAIQEQAHAFLTSQVMSNVSVLMLQARAHIWRLTTDMSDPLRKVHGHRGTPMRARGAPPRPAAESDGAGE